ncbi:triose-phosphate isomerase [Akkermansiaceae bacterium]|jgi:triosephosphate isomerase|nr:triose-phosphate isomerase [Akkermansiaceae bacterium]
METTADSTSGSVNRPEAEPPIILLPLVPSAFNAVLDMRKPIIAANWKLNKGPSDTEDFIRGFESKLADFPKGVDIVLAPPFVSLVKATELLSQSRVRVSAQNMSEQDNGAYTGEISAFMLKEIFVQYVILGHSERRAIYGETDAIINAKVLKAHEVELKPIFCIGETLQEREDGKLEKVLRTQITDGLKDVTEKQMLDTVIAYEPVWAIGTGVTASPQQAQDAHAFVRSVITDLYGISVSEKVRIQYGGSVKPGNAAELLGQKDIDGALVGGAALEVSSFADLIKNGVPE